MCCWVNVSSKRYRVKKLKELLLLDTKLLWSIQKQMESSLNTYQMIKPVFFAINLGDLWIVVKGKSNIEIACSQRNFFKESVKHRKGDKVKHFFCEGCFNSILSNRKLRMYPPFVWQIDSVPKSTPSNEKQLKLLVMGSK